MPRRTETVVFDYTVGVAEQPDGSCAVVAVSKDGLDKLVLPLTVEGRRTVGRQLLGIEVPAMVVPRNGG